MKNQAQKINAHCPIAGCKTKKSHRSDKHVDALMRVTELPHLMCEYVIGGLAALGNSSCNDLANRNAFGFLTRQRQIQELYIKTLYLLLIATPDEQAHMVSGEMPNSMVAYYRKVNDLIFHKQTDWEATTPGLNDDSFTVMETLNDGAHVSFKSLLMARGFYEHPSPTTPERFAEYIARLISKLTYMHGMFKDGRSKEHILEGMQAMHRPESYWTELARKARYAATTPQP